MVDWNTTQRFQVELDNLAIICPLAPPTAVGCNTAVVRPSNPPSNPCTRTAMYTRRPAKKPSEATKNVDREDSGKAANFQDFDVKLDQTLLYETKLLVLV